MSMSPSIHSEQIREATFALIQMSCDTDPDENREKAVTKIRMAAEQGAQVMVLQELFASQYFCFTEDYDHFGLAETIPGTSTRIFSELAKELGVVIVASLFEKGLKDFTTIPRLLSMPMVRWLECTEKCISQTILAITRNFILLREILVTRFSPRDLAE